MKKLILIILLIFSYNCSKGKTYSVTGTLIEIKTDHKEFIIHHDEIPGFMMAMTMPFKLNDTLYLNQFEIGDSLKFNLTINDQNVFADDFKLLGKGTINSNQGIWDDDYAPIEIGEVLTDITLLNLDSNKISLSDTDGKFRLISFIFTRCPMPNMCPAVIVKNQYLAKKFEKQSNIEFILISFDYAYDTPSVLKQTYQPLEQSNSNLKILSSTNHINDIFTLGGQSNVSFWGIEENDIGHTLRSILIDPERRLMQAFEGLNWKPEKAERDIKNILKAYNL